MKSYNIVSLETEKDPNYDERLEKGCNIPLKLFFSNIYPQKSIVFAKSNTKKKRLLSRKRSQKKPFKNW